MSNPIFAPEILRAFSHATDAMTAASRRGWALPAAYNSATAVLETATQLATAPAPQLLNNIPTDPAKVAGFVSKAASERAAWANSREVANEVADAARLAVIRAAREAGPELLTRLCDAADELTAEFGALLDTAPRAVTGYETAEQLDQHAALLRCSAALSVAAADRGTLALLSAEAADLGSTGGFWLLVQPRPDTSLQAIGRMASALQGRIPAGLGEWVPLQLLGLRVARAGEAGTRLEAYGRALQAGQRRPDGGMLDRTWQQATAEAGLAAAR